MDLARELRVICLNSWRATHFAIAWIDWLHDMYIYRKRIWNTTIRLMISFIRFVRSEVFLAGSCPYTEVSNCAFLMLQRQADPTVAD